MDPKTPTSKPSKEAFPRPLFAQELNGGLVVTFMASPRASHRLYNVVPGMPDTSEAKRPENITGFRLRSLLGPFRKLLLRIKMARKKKKPTPQAPQISRDELPQPSKESKTDSTAKKKLSKLEFMRAVQAKLKEQAPLPKVLGMPEAEQIREVPPRPSLMDLLEEERQRLILGKKKELDRMLEQDPLLARLQKELDESKRDLAPQHIQRRLEKEIWILKNKAKAERQQELQDETGPLWERLKRIMVAVPAHRMPEVKFFESYDQIKIEPDMPIYQYTLDHLARRLMSPKDRRAMVAIHQMSLQEGTEQEFLQELERQLMRGAKAAPERLK